ncbi:unnamed protein product [Caenorhabditis bovis]|uniref:Uncharacterized protein n=1 Tax=Caenorhabditis bovis TaxID=2654633 RepID=A0A8S1EHR9_9PELO|nr:unnamed protein product [Caenorhabditis bovis]
MNNSQNTNNVQVHKIINPENDSSKIVYLSTCIFKLGVQENNSYDAQLERDTNKDRVQKNLPVLCPRNCQSPSYTNAEQRNGTSCEKPEGTSIAPEPVKTEKKVKKFVFKKVMNPPKSIEEEIAKYPNSKFYGSWND